MTYFKRIVKPFDTYVDLVLCVDVTASMKPIIETVKKMALSFYDDIVSLLPEKLIKVCGFRVKVIAFRDYYCDGAYAMEESGFFCLPTETSAFSEYVLNLKACGGCDGSKNALEALVLAMKCLRDEGCELPGRLIHIIAMCTDASAHPLEPDKLRELEKVKSDYYPHDMLESLAEMKEAWNGVSQSGNSADYTMDQKAKRLVLFTPNSYPWDEIGGASPWDCVSVSSISEGKGGRELDASSIWETLASVCYH